jgi:hypothetical protein
VPEQSGVFDISYIESLRAALVRFRGKSEEVSAAADQQISQSLDWLSQRARYWRAEVARRQSLVEEAQARLRSCQDSGSYDPRTGTYLPPDCRAFEVALLEARTYCQQAVAEHENVQRWGKLVQQQVDAFYAQARRLKAFLSSELPSATTLLSNSTDALAAYAAVQAAVPLASQVASDGSAPPQGDLAGLVGPSHDIQDVPLNDIDLSDSYLKSDADYKKVAREEMVLGLKRLEEVVRPAVLKGADADYFYALDEAQGLDPAHGYHNLYLVFYSNNSCIKLERVGDKYHVNNGYHRLAVARELGLTTIPAQVVTAPH